MNVEVIQTGPLKVNTCIVSLGGSGVLIIDPASSSFSKDEFILTDYLEKNGLVPVMAILTHGHFDHIAGLKILHEKYPDMFIAIHQADSSSLGLSSFEIQKSSLEAFHFTDFIPFVSDLPEANCILSDDHTLAECINSKIDSNYKEALSQWMVIHTPGHSPGSVCIYNRKEKILFSGDTLFFQGYGRTDVLGGDGMELIKSLTRLGKDIEQNAIVYPGHDRYGFLMAENGII